MKKLSDEEIQKLVEEGLLMPTKSLHSQDDDVKVYSLLFDALAQKQEVSLSRDFADAVVNKVQTKKLLVSTLKHYAFLLLFVAICLGATVATFAYMDSSIGNNILGMILEFKWAILFGVVIIMVVQVLDQALIRNKFMNN